MKGAEQGSLGPTKITYHPTFLRYAIITLKTKKKPKLHCFDMFT